MITTSEKISLISAVAAVIQALVVTVTLIFIYRQTAALRRTANDLDRGAKLNSYTNLRSNIHEINKLLLEHDHKDELHPEFVKYVEDKWPEMGSLNPAPVQFYRRRRKNRKRAYSGNKRT